VSGSLSVEARVGVTGPLADGKAAGILDRYAQDVEQAIGNRAVELLGAFPMNKTGRGRGGFRANLHTMRQERGVVIRGPMIEGVTWAPWLEGTSKRNRSTGFGGYHLFRKTRGQLDREAAQIAQRELQPYLEQLGGD
jgi:hypothetical protein